MTQCGASCHGGGQGRGRAGAGSCPVGGLGRSSKESPSPVLSPGWRRALCCPPLLCLTPDTRPVSDLVTRRAGGPQPEAGGVRRGGYLGGMVSMFPRQREPRGLDGAGPGRRPLSAGSLFPAVPPAATHPPPRPSPSLASLSRGLPLLRASDGHLGRSRRLEP